MLKKVLGIAAVALAGLFAVGCAVGNGDGGPNIQDMSSVSSASKNLAATQVTVPLPTINLHLANRQGVPPAQVSISDNVYTMVFPVDVVPTGAVLNQIRARVKGTDTTQCYVALWQQHDETVISAVNSNWTTGHNYQTLTTSPTPALVNDSLSSVFFTLERVGNDGCGLAAAEVTYTTAL